MLNLRPTAKRMRSGVGGGGGGVCELGGGGGAQVFRSLIRIWLTPLNITHSTITTKSKQSIMNTVNINNSLCYN